MQKHVKMSIITVSFNCADTIERTIRSVLKQDYPYIEYIIIDGGSTDGTKEIIQKYANELTYWVSEPDTGIYNAMNKALQHVTGDFVNFQGGDDYLYDEHVLSCVAEYAEESDADILIGNSDVGGVIKDTCPKSFDELLLNVPNHQAMFVKRILFERIGGFDENIRYVADYDWSVRACMIGAITEHVDITICHYSVDGFSADVKVCKELIELQLSYTKKLNKQYLENDILFQRVWMVRNRIIKTYVSEKRARVERVLKVIFREGKCSVWGIGKAGRDFIKLLQLYGIEITEIIDKDYMEYKGQFEKIKVNKFDKQKDYAIILIAAYGAEGNIENELLQNKREYIVGRDYMLGSKLLRVILNIGLEEYGLEQYYCF